MESVQSVVVTEFGGYDCLQVKPWPLPRAMGPADVQVAVEVCGLNFADLYTRQGLLRVRKPPFVLGIECAGHVTAVGENVTDIKVGDRVACYEYTGGLYRERVVVEAAHCFVLPPAMSLEHGAALVVNYLTAFFCLLDMGHLRPGQSVLIPSCAGGVGWAATQLARSVGLVTIFGTCSASKKDAALKNGVTHVLDHEQYEQQLLDISPEGVDVVIDNMAGSAFATSQRLLKPLGRVVLIGSNSVLTDARKLGMWSLLRMWWSTKSVAASELIGHNRLVGGLHLGLLLQRQPGRVRDAMQRILELYTEGKIQPQIDSVWPLQQVVEATKVLAERRNVGKVLLKIESANKEEEAT